MLSKGKVMLFSESQLEGLAKVCDNLATACVVGSIVGGLIDHKIGMGVVLVLWTMAVIFLAAALYCRRPAATKEDEENGN